jgi:hypothetical protein
MRSHLRASDGLPLIKSVSLKKTDGTEFEDWNYVTDYLGHILKQVSPTTTMRVYFDIYHASMNPALGSLWRRSNYGQRPLKVPKPVSLICMRRWK